LEWVKKVLVAEKMVDEEDLELFEVVDAPEDAVRVIDEFYSRYLLSPNF
jgi:predicted Rossmann-fold nucleotide-binding protein